MSSVTVKRSIGVQVIVTESFKAELKAELEKSGTAVTELRAKLEKSGATEAALRAELAGSAGRLAAAESEAGERRSELEKARRELECRTSERDQLQQTVRRAEHELTESQRRCQTLTDTVSDKTQVTAESLTQVADTSPQISS